MKIANKFLMKKELNVHDFVINHFDVDINEFVPEFSIVKREHAFFHYMYDNGSLLAFEKSKMKLLGERLESMTDMRDDYATKMKAINKLLFNMLAKYRNLEVIDFGQFFAPDEKRSMKRFAKQLAKSCPRLIAIKAHPARCERLLNKYYIEQFNRKSVLQRVSGWLKACGDIKRSECEDGTVTICFSTAYVWR